MAGHVKDEIFYDKEQKSAVRRSRQKDPNKEFADVPKGAPEPTGELVGVPGSRKPVRHLNPRDQRGLDAIEAEVKLNTQQLVGVTQTPPSTPPKQFDPKPGVNSPTRPTTTPVQRPAGAATKDSGLQSTHQEGAQSSSDPMRSSKQVEKK